MCKGCRLEAAWEPQIPSGHFALGRAKVGSGKACKLSAGERAHWGLGRAKPSREGGGKVVRQLSGPAGPSAYGAVVLGCFVLKNFQRARPSGPPRCCRRGGALSRWFANKTASAQEGKETCPKWQELSPSTARGALAAAFPRDGQVCGCGQAGSAAFGGAGAPANHLVAAL